MFPLDFEEYLWALGEEMLCEEIKRAFDENAALPGALHKKALDPRGVQFHPGSACEGE